MQICPTIFLKMKRECILVQWKCNEMVTSATPPSHHRKEKTVNTWSISFLIHSCSTNYVALSMIIFTSHCLSTHTQKSI